MGGGWNIMLERTSHLAVDVEPMVGQLRWTLSQHPESISSRGLYYEY